MHLGIAVSSGVSMCRGAAYGVVTCQRQPRGVICEPLFERKGRMKNAPTPIESSTAALTAIS